MTAAEVVDENCPYEHIMASISSLSKSRGIRLYPSARLLCSVEDFIGSQYQVRLEKVLLRRVGESYARLWYVRIVQASRILRLHLLAILGLHQSSIHCHFHLQHSTNQRMSFDDKIQSLDDKSQSYVEEEYALGRWSASSYASSLQSNFQHHLFRELLGYLIHPSILSSSNLPSNPKIADIGAGTGQWLIDVHRLLPSAHLDGFDISKDQYPSDAWLPAQISLQELDIMKPLPSSLENEYDVVHVQLSFGVVQQDGPDNMLKQLYKMLSRSS